MTWQQLGLGIYVTVAVGQLLVLGYDLWLGETGQMMITDYCRAKPWLAYLLLMANCAGLMGLAVHFMSSVKMKVFPD